MNNLHNYLKTLGLVLMLIIQTVFVRAQTIWSNDFSNVAHWSIGAPNVQGQWQVVTTTPSDVSNYIGAMASATAANGFGVFNGIQYLLSASVDPQNATLTYNGTLDFSTYAQVTFSFEQRYRRFNTDETWVEFSVDGGATWTAFRVNADKAANGPIAQEKLSLDISSVVGGEPAVRFRFRWTNPSGDDQYGSGYAWMVDDVSFDENVEDNEDPDITCAVSNQVVSASSGACTYIHSGTGWDATATDNIGVASIGYELTGATAGTGTSLDGVAFNSGETTVTWTATDASDNTKTCSFTVTVNSNVPLVIEGPGELSSETLNSVAAVFSTTELWSPSGSSAVKQRLDDAFGAENWDHYTSYATVSAQQLFGGDYGYVYLEGGDNTANEFRDFITQNRTLIENWVANGGHLFMNSAPNEGGNIDLGFGGFTLLFNIGVTGNTQGLVQTPAHPVFNGPLTPASGNFTGGYFAHAIVSPFGTDHTVLIKGENNGDIVVEYPYGSGIVVFSGLTTPNFHSPQPNALNWISNLHTYLEQPVEKPYQVAVGTDAGSCEYTAVDGMLDPVVVDPCNTGYTISHDYAGAADPHTLNGAVFPLGNVTIKWTIVDHQNNTYTRTVIVKVTDNENPVIASGITADQIMDTDADVCTYTHSGTAWDATGTDNCTVAGITYTLTGATTGSGTSLDGVVFNPGETTVTWTVTDAADNTATHSFDVVVEDNENPVITCIANQIVATATDACTYTHNGTSWDVTATDNCSVTSIIYELSGATIGTGTSLDGIIFNIGETTVTWTATDASDNTKTCSFTVTVEDQTAPTVLTKNLIVSLDALGNANITANDVDAGTTDACGVASLVLSKTSFTHDDLGEQSVTLTATDVNGNSANGTARVVVVSFSDRSLVYDGTAKSLYLDGSLPVGVNVIYTNNEQTQVGTYTVTAAIDGGSEFNNLTLTAQLSITPRPLTVTATASNKIYDGTTAATVTLSDNRVPGDQLTVTHAPATFNNKNVGNNKPVSVTGISLSGTDAGNYTFNTTALATANITPRPLTVTAAASNKVYDGTTAATVTLSDNRVSGDVLTITHTPATFNNKNVGTGKPVSVTGISLSGTDAGNYTVNATATATANITARALTVTAVASNKVYDGTTAATVTLSDNRVSGDVLTITHASATFNNKNVGNNKPVSVTGISISGTDAGNYTFNTTASSTANITVRALTVTAVASNKVYDGTTAATVTLSDNRVSGDQLTVTHAPATFNNKNVGTGKPVSVTGISISGTDAGNYTFNTTASSTANITARALTVTATASNKVYDGTTAATVTLGDNRVSGDQLTITHTPATFNNKNVGNNKPVSVTGISLSGTDAGNYTVNATASATANITARVLTVTATASNKVYDGTTAATVTLSDNRVPGDQLTVTHASATFSDANAGNNKPVSVTGISLSGADAGNYTFNTTASATADISRAPQTITFVSPGTLGRDAGTVSLDVESSSGLPVELSIDDDMIATVSSTDLTMTVKRLGTVTVTATQAGNHNYLPADPVSVTIRIANDAGAALPIRVHQAVSPNGDGINDFLMIEGIRDYPENRVTIFDKSGRVLAEIEGYDNRDRVFTGQYVNDGTYYYYLDIRDGSQWKREKGFFVVKRTVN